MEKKLPKVFANTIEKELNNNERVYYDRGEVKEEKVESKTNISSEFTINQKINKIFGSSRYVYKADVKIKLNDGNTVDKKIIGRNKNELIIEHTQEVPEYKKVYLFNNLGSLIEEDLKIFIIDENEYNIMLLAEEY